MQLETLTLKSAHPLEDVCMKLAHNIAIMRSKDPRTKVGSCLYDTRTGSFHLGYNGFPQGIADLPERWEDRDTKHKYVVHAEINTILKALTAGADMKHSVLFITHHPCHRCMGMIISCGIKEVRFANNYPEDTLADSMAKEAGVNCLFYEFT